MSKRKKGTAEEITSYYLYLRSPQWEKVRDRYRKSGMSKGCAVCGTKRNIDLHHRTYERVGGRERLSDLVALCNPHHKQFHRAFMNQKDISLYDYTNKWIKDQKKKREKRKKRGVLTKTKSRPTGKRSARVRWGPVKVYYREDDSGIL